MYDSRFHRFRSLSRRCKSGFLPCLLSRCFVVETREAAGGQVAALHALQSCDSGAAFLSATRHAPALLRRASVPALAQRKAATKELRSCWVGEKGEKHAGSVK